MADSLSDTIAPSARNMLYFAARSGELNFWEKVPFVQKLAFTF